MKKMLSILSTLAIATTLSTSVTSCSDVMGRNYKQRVDSSYLKNEEVNNLFISEWSKNLNTYLRALPENITSWEDANNLVKNSGYYVPRYVTSNTVSKILRDSTLTEDFKKPVREISTYYTLKTTFLSTSLVYENDVITGINYNIAIDGVSPRDREFLDAWLSFDCFVPVTAYGNLPSDVYEEIMQISHTEEKTVWVKGDYDPNTESPVWVEETQTYSKYDFWYFEIIASDYLNLDTATYTARQYNSSAEFIDIVTIKDFTDFIVNIIKQEASIASDIEISATIKMQNDKEIQGDEELKNVVRLLSSSLIYIDISRPSLETNENFKNVSSFTGTTAMLFDDEAVLN